MMLFCSLARRNSNEIAMSPRIVCSLLLLLLLLLLLSISKPCNIALDP